MTGLDTGKHYDAELYTVRAERFIRESKDPFFLLRHTPSPIFPNEALDR